MLSVAHVIGVDPGLVHTGTVGIEFDPLSKVVAVDHHVSDGLDPDDVQTWIQSRYPGHRPEVFIEKYVPRLRLGSDERMVKGEAAFLSTLKHVGPVRLIRNTGVKQMVPQELMQLLNVWQFPTSTHHQDLRSAARIALYGLMRDNRLNLILAECIRDHLDGRTWEVV